MAIITEKYLKQKIFEINNQYSENSIGPDALWKNENIALLIGRMQILQDILIELKR